MSIAAPCEPATFAPEAWLATRSQGLLATQTPTPQSGRALTPIAAQSLADRLVERESYLGALREIVGPWPARPPLTARDRARQSDFLQIIALAAPRAHMLQTPIGDTI